MLSTDRSGMWQMHSLLASKHLLCLFQISIKVFKVFSVANWLVWVWERFLSECVSPCPAPPEVRELTPLHWTAWSGGHWTGGPGGEKKGYEENMRKGKNKVGVEGEQGTKKEQSSGWRNIGNQKIKEKKKKNGSSNERRSRERNKKRESEQSVRSI